VRRTILASAVIAAAVMSSTASGAFFLDEGRILSTEKGEMGKFQPYNPQGRATFETPSGNMASKQARYKDAELMVDLAYTPVSQRGSGEPGIVPGFGEALPFTDAMTMILPSGWQFFRDKTIELKAVPANISFSGGKSWPEVLRQVGDRYALHFHIDWFDKTIMMGKGRPSMASHASQIAVIPEPGRSAAVSKPAIAATSSTTQPSSILGGARSLPAPTTPVAVQAAGFTASTAGSITGTAAAPVRVAVAPPKPLPPPIPTWKVGMNDRSIRQALAGWSKAAGWTFEAEHWAVPVDIPITAGASFSGDFKTATRQLIGTTELGDTPLQPCFYTNKVVRVVPINEMCNPMSAR